MMRPHPTLDQLPGEPAAAQSLRRGRPAMGGGAGKRARPPHGYTESRGRPLAKSWKPISSAFADGPPNPRQEPLHRSEGDRRRYRKQALARRKPEVLDLD